MSGPEATFARPHGVVAVLDTSALVRARQSAVDRPNVALILMLGAGAAYDSFTSPAIIEETKEVLARPRFGARPDDVDRWLDAFIRASRQVFPQLAPGGSLGAVRGDADDLPILETAYAAYVTTSEHHPVTGSFSYRRMDAEEKESSTGLPGDVAEGSGDVGPARVT